MGFYRKKPVVIEARRTGEGYDEDCEILGWCEGELLSPDEMEDFPPDFLFKIQTLEGPLYVTSGDWIIQGVQGEFYPCKNDVFVLTYELDE